MIVFSNSLVASIRPAESTLWPLFGWHNLVMISNIEADHELDDFPVTNLANPQTNSLWKSGSTADQTITITLSGGEEVDYIGIARHNWGSARVRITIDAMSGEDGSDWEEVKSDTYLGDDKPTMLLFEANFWVGVRINLYSEADAPQAAVLYVGKSMRMPTGIPPGHSPLLDALEARVSTPVSENGEFIGDIVLSERLQTTADFRLIDGSWYRNNMRAFVRQRTPFFFAWSPELHPSECAFAKLTNDPKPVINQATGEMDISLGMVGLAL